MSLSTEILVIGGGATGLGVAWDAALRGYKTLLAEKGDLAHGTSGRYHGLLHSGGRYVVRDPHSAHDCYHENLIIRKLIPSAIEDTGGFFVALDEDPPDYVEPFLRGCAAAGIPAEEIPPAVARSEEPLLSPRLARIFRVPDASCDSFDASHAVAGAIRAAGGEVWLRHKLVKLLLEGQRVTGAEFVNILTGEAVVVRADLVISCAGAWAGQVAALAGCEVKVTPGKGTMVAMNYRLANTVLNRLKPPSDGDILVPVGTVAVMGTTDRPVEDPDHYAVERWEIELLLNEGAKLLPRFREFRPLRAWAGVRPLFQDRPKAAKPGEASTQTESRLMTRAHSVLDHASRDGVEGLISVVGGKFTTFRLMAQETVDLAGRKLGSERRCLTAETLIEPAGQPLHFLASRLKRSESRQQPSDHGETICECELVDRAQVEAALRKSRSLVINDLRRDLRLGMGPCQAGFCSFRAAGLLHRLFATDGGSAPPDGARPDGQGPEQRPGAADIAQTNSALIEFLQERWKGMRPVMWGANLRQLELDLGLYRNLLGADHLPRSRAPEVYPTEKTA